MCLSRAAKVGSEYTIADKITEHIREYIDPFWEFYQIFYQIEFKRFLVCTFRNEAI